MAGERQIVFDLRYGGQGAGSALTDWYVFYSPEGQAGLPSDWSVSSESPNGCTMTLNAERTQATLDYSGFDGNICPYGLGVFLTFENGGDDEYDGVYRFAPLPGEAEEVAPDVIRTPAFRWPRYADIYRMQPGTWQFTDEHYWEGRPPIDGWNVEPVPNDSGAPLFLDITWGTTEFPWEDYYPVRVGYALENGDGIVADLIRYGSRHFGSCILPSGSLYCAYNDGDNVGIRRWTGGHTTREEIATVPNAQNPSIFMIHGAFYLAHVDSSKKTVLARSLDGAHTFTLMPTEIWDNSYRNAVVAPTVFGGAVTVAIKDKQAWFRRSDDLREWSAPIVISTFSNPSALNVHEKSISGESTLIVTDGVTIVRSLDGGRTWGAF